VTKSSNLVLLSHTDTLLAICAAGTSSTTRETDSITGEIRYTLNTNHEKNWRKRQIFQNDNNNLPILIKYSHFEKMWKNPSFSPNFPMIVQAAHLRRVVRSGCLMTGMALHTFVILSLFISIAYSM